MNKIQTYSHEEIAKNLKYLDETSLYLLNNITNPKPAERLLDFTTTTFPQYRPEKFNALLASKLDDVASGKIKRLIISAPPQHGKSELASVRFPAFWLGKNPDSPILLASYSASLAEDKGRQVRAIVESDEYHKVFPKVTTSNESRAVDLWHLDKYRGYMRSVGVGGAITGYGGMLGIIDDAVSNYEDANSKTIQDKTWDWYRTTFRTRVWENGSIVVIMTRWSSEDLIGRILTEEGPENWHILRIPALSETQAERDRANAQYGLVAGLPDVLKREPGEALSPKRFSVATLLDLKSDVGVMGWAALYQGAPTSAEGNRFKRDWFKKVISLNEAMTSHNQTGQVAWTDLPRVRSWDMASSEDKGGDYTVGTLLAYDSKENTTYIEDVIRVQYSSGKRDDLILKTAQKDAEVYGNKVQIFIEQQPGSAGKDVALILLKMLREFPVTSATATGSKEVRVEPFAKAAEGEFIRLIKSDRWNVVVVDELMSFPNGSHDDCVDSISQGYNVLAKFKPKRIIKSY